MQKSTSRVMESEYEIQRERDRLSDSQTEYVDNILRSGQHLLQLINDILDISAIESCKLEINENDVEVATLVNEVMRLMEPRADANKVLFSSKIENNLPTLHGDERRFRQILLNLIKNFFEISVCYHTKDNKDFLNFRSLFRCHSRLMASSFVAYCSAYKSCQVRPRVERAPVPALCFFNLLSKSLVQPT